MDIIQIIEDNLNTPLSDDIKDVLRNLDVNGQLEHIKAIEEKDRKRIQLFVPIALERFASLAITAGINIGQAIQDDGKPDTDIHALEDAARNATEQLQSFMVEVSAAVRYWANSAIDMAKAPLSGDRLKDAREMIRIVANRWDFDTDYQNLLGVSAGTPDQFPDWFTEKWM